jgi:Rho-binding antiterminator
MTDYIPVDCGLHSEYELAVMHRQILRLTWRDIDGELHTETVLPEDLLIRHHEEFLVVNREGCIGVEIRLDHILHFEHS